MLDTLTLLLLKTLAWVVQRAPERVSLTLLTGIAKLVFFLQPKHLSYARKNLRLAYPNSSSTEHERILHALPASLARLLRDALRIPVVTPAWAEKNVAFPDRKRFQEIRKKHQSGTLIATGHLGSFELLPHVLNFATSTSLSFVVRNFTLPKVEAWWRSVRERNGDRVINREGAYKNIVRTLRRGRDVGILFDQNVTRNHAVFVDWFGTEAATTKALALSALQAKAPIVVLALCYVGEGRSRAEKSYKIEYGEVPTEDIYTNLELSKEEKVLAITSRTSDAFVELIRKYPEQWFWYHRRWRTRPEGEVEFY